MDTVTVSHKFQVVIPLTIRRSLGIRPGQKVQVIRYGDRIELIFFTDRDLGKSFPRLLRNASIEVE